jgi:3-hydroxybutyrate dehydrogenase
MKTILITGAGSGVGRGLAACFAANGHAIIAADLNAEGAETTAAQIREVGGQAEGRSLDVRSAEQIDALWDSLQDRPVDVLVNNAGLQHVAAVEEFPIEKWDLLMDVMMRGTFLMTRAALPGMKARNFGRIIHIGSIHAQVASPFKSAYVTAKHALQGFSKVTALETAGHDITSNIICPSYILTPLVEAQIRDQARTRCIPEHEVIDKVMLEPMPKKAFITFEEIAAAAEYLMSPLARNVTGQTITIDGGWTAR